MRLHSAGSLALRAVGSAVTALVLLASAALADGAPNEQTGRHVGMHTGVLDFPPAGDLVLSLGLEYLPDVTNDLAGVRGELARLPTIGIGLGLSDNAQFQVIWPAFNRLRVHSQSNPPPLGRNLGAVSTDWGDVTLATIIQLEPPNGAVPGYGLRFAAKLPNSNEKLGIGDNTTDVFASALFATRPTPRFAFFTDIGVGILSARTAAFTQNDVLTYGALADWRASDRVRWVGEWTGRYSTHDGGPGTGTRSEVRAGVEIGRGSLHASALLLRGLTGWDSRGVGASLNVSTQIAALKRH